MDSANRLAWWRQFRVDVAAGSGLGKGAADAVAKGFGIPFLQGPRSETGAEDAGDELTQEEEDQLAQMAVSVGRLFPFVPPSPTFRARLQQALVAEHRRRLGNGAAVPAPQESGISWRWSLAATVPLVIGVLATILWRRSHRSNAQLISPVGGR